MDTRPGFSRLKDDEFTAAFENCTLDPSNFHHADHLRLAWIYARQFGAAVAEQKLLNGIRNFANHAGVPQKFLYTATAAWARLVASGLDADSAELTFQEWLPRNALLLDKNLLDRFYSKDVLQADAARNGWVAPDLKALSLG